MPNRVQISGLTDVYFTNQDPAIAAASAQNVCVWSNTSTKGYNVTASGSGTASAFTLANGALTVPYSVEWAQTSGQSTGTALATGDGSDRAQVDRDERALRIRPKQQREPDRQNVRRKLADHAGRDQLHRAR